jgi:hypothetical protein
MMPMVMPAITSPLRYPGRYPLPHVSGGNICVAVLRACSSSAGTASPRGTRWKGV